MPIFLISLIHKKNKSLYIISPRGDLNILYPSLKMIDFNNNFFKGTRNPFNSGDTYSGYLYLNSKDWISMEEYSKTILEEMNI